MFRQAMVDRMKPLGSSLAFATSKGGTAHIQMAGPSVLLGAEIRDLAVLPADVKSEAEACA